MTALELESTKNVSIPDHKAYCFNSWPLEYRRVKLYEVNPENGNWIDCGTGFLNLNKNNDKFNIVVLSDESSNFEKEVFSQRKETENLLENESLSNNKLVNTPIDLNREYCHQKESIITWQDGINSDLYRALSFQHSESCNTIWNMITSLVPHLCVDLLEGEFAEESTGYAVFDRPASNNIDQIIDDLELDSNINSENTIMDILSREFLNSLFDLMEEFEQKSDIVGLHKIFQVIRRIIVLYSSFNEVFETLLSDEYYLKFFKACEYDETLENYKVKFSHKKFLENVKFHCVVPLPEVQTIHLNYRLMYLRDVVMPRHLDEQSLQRIATIINNNFSSIISMIITTSDIWKFLKENIQKNFLVAKFIHAVLTVLKQNPTLSIYERHQIFINLKANNILSEFYGYLNEDCIGARQMLELSSSNDDCNNISNSTELSFIYYSNIMPVELAIEVYSMVCEINPGLLRHAIHESTPQYVKINKEAIQHCSDTSNDLRIDGGFQRKQEECLEEVVNLSNRSNNFHSLWATLCEIFINSKSESVQVQICTIFKRILDPKTMDVPERDDSLSLFYDMGILDRLIVSLLDGSQNFTEFNSLYSARVLFCDILANCVQEHNYRIKYKILQNHLPQKLLRIATRPFHKIFSISVVKFLRTCLGTRDDFYYRLFTKYDIFKYIFLIMDQLKVPRNRGEGSILESVIIEMLDFICRNNIQLILKYLLENYIDTIRNLNFKASKGSKCRVFSRMLESFNIISKATPSMVNCKKASSNISPSTNAHSSVETERDEKSSNFVFDKREICSQSLQFLDRGASDLYGFRGNITKGVNTINDRNKAADQIGNLPLAEASQVFEDDDFDKFPNHYKEQEKRLIRKKKIEIQLKLS